MTGQNSSIIVAKKGRSLAKLEVWQDAALFYLQKKNGCISIEEKNDSEDNNR